MRGKIQNAIEWVHSRAPNAERAYKYAKLCGVVPLVFGVSIFVLWLLTRWSPLAGAGWFTMYYGTYVLACGAIALAWASYLSWRRDDVATKRLVVRRAILGSVLFLANVVAAAGIIVLVSGIQTHFQFVWEVHNDD